MLDRASGLRILCPLVGLLLADCATAVAQPGPAGPPPANYRQIVSDGDAANILRDDKLADSNLRSALGIHPDDNTWVPKVGPNGQATLSVSSLRKTLATEQGDWFACLKAVRGGSVSYYGISFIGAEIVDWRPAVVIDHCEKQAYGPLPPPSKKAKKGDGARSRPRQ